MGYNGSEVCVGSKTVVTGSGKLGGVLMTPGGSADFNVIIYDNTEDSGDVLFSTTVKQAKSGQFFDLSQISIPYNTGLYAKLTGAGGGVIIYYN